MTMPNFETGIKILGRSGTLKQELVYHNIYITRQEAIQDISEYVEIFYDWQRKQKWLWGVCCLLLMKKGCRHVRFGVHY